LHYFPAVPVDPQPCLPPPARHKVQFHLPTPAVASAPSVQEPRALPAPVAPPVTAMQKATPAAPAAPASAGAAALALLSDLVTSSDASRLSLPPAVAARLRSLLERQDAGEPLTPAERAEAHGLLDLAEYFVVQRLRQRLAA
jgi:hypothetical protein